MRVGWVKFLVGFVGSILVSAVYVMLSGILSIQADGVRRGAQFDLTNQLIGIIEPSFPLLQFAASAAMGATVAYALINSGSSGGLGKLGVLVGGLSGCIILIAWSRELDELFAVTPQALPYGPEGWIQFGGQDSAFHLVTVLIAVALVQNVWQRRQESKSASPDAVAPDSARESD